MRTIIFINTLAIWLYPIAKICDSIQHIAAPSLFSSPKQELKKLKKYFTEYYLYITATQFFVFDKTTSYGYYVSHKFDKENIEQYFKKTNNILAGVSLKNG